MRGRGGSRTSAPGPPTTRSPYLVATPRERQELVAAVRQLVSEPELAGRDRFAMPQVTRIDRAMLR